MANNHPAIKREDLMSIRTLMSGAAPLGASDVELFRSKTKNKINIIQGYGMTETSPVTVIQSNSLENGIKIGGSGFLVPNTEAKIIPVDGSSKLGLGPNQSGELVIKGPQVMAGYYNNPEANSDIFLEEGWLKTGDIAHYDEHEHFYVTDRLKELIKVKGFQVPPAELEAVLRTHPSVDDVGVVGIPHPALGEAPKAFVVLKPGQSVKPARNSGVCGSESGQTQALNGRRRVRGRDTKKSVGENSEESFEKFVKKFDGMAPD
jgi:4-coumarate--CoA ligase